MKIAKLWIFLFSLVLFSFNLCAPVFAGRCPALKAVKLMMKKTFNVDARVVKVQASPIAGLCQAQVRSKWGNRIVYLDAAGKYLMSGYMFRVSDRLNLTQRIISRLNRFTPSQLKTLDSLTAFSRGGGKVLYFVTDPQCSYCQIGRAHV